MKKILLYIVLVAAGAVLVANVIQHYSFLKSKKVPNAFKTVPPASGTNFVRFDTISTTNNLKKVFWANLAVVRISKDSVPLVDSVFEMGSFSTIDSNQLKFKNSRNELLDIYAGMPTGMYFKQMVNQKGIIHAGYHSSLNGSNEFFDLESNNKLVIGYVWQTRPSPVLFSSTSGVFIQQTAVYPLPVPDSYVNSKLLIHSDSGNLIADRPGLMKFRQGGMLYSLFIQTSAYHKVNEKGGDTQSGYVLHFVLFQD